jgi:hypothetical protein
MPNLYSKTALLLCLLLAVDRAPLAAQDFKWSGAVPAGQTLEIKGITGGIRAQAASGAEALVTAVKTARKSEPESVKIEVIKHDGGVTICAVYPSKRSTRPNVCTPGPDSHQEVQDNDVSVKFTVLVPAGVRFAGTTVNGGVDADGLDGPVSLSTVNGSVSLAIRGGGEATTVNGGITASLGRADWKDELAFTTVNGNITLTLPASLSTELEASTVNGAIDSDFPLLVRGKISPRKITGTIGSGGRELKLSTVNGSIRLRKAT